jgi:hypothetical protein
MSSCNCYGRGVVLAVPKGEPETSTPFAFRCQCSSGAARRMNYPVWSSDSLREYKPLEQSHYAPDERRRPLKIVPLRADIDL